MNERTGEAGFTLVEMLLTMVLLGVVIVPLSAAIFLGLHTESDVQVRLAESNSANLVASYFAADVQQALVVGTDTNDSAFCGASAGPVKLLLTIPSLDQTIHSVSYFVIPDPHHNNEFLLQRRTCNNDAPTGPPGGIPVVHNLSGDPVVTCSPADCTGTVTLTVTQLVAGKNPYTTTLVGTRRFQ